MTAVTSTVPAVYTALTTGLRAVVSGDGHEGKEVLVSYGGSVDKTPPDHIVFGSVQKGDNEWSYLGSGRKRREETYLACIGFNCRRSGAEATAALEAAYELLAALENMIADDPCIGLAETVSPTLVAQLVMFEHKLTPDLATNGWLCSIDVKVHISVRLN